MDHYELNKNVFKELVNLHSLKIDFFYFEVDLNLSRLVEVLRYVPNLKILHICDINLIEDVKIMEQSADLESASSSSETIKFVELNLIELHCNSEIIQILKCSTLKVFNLRWHCNLSEQRKSNVCKFLSMQKELEDLYLIHPNDFFKFSQNYEFKLKRFGFVSNDSIQDEEIIKFLEPQKHFLNCLKIQIYSFDLSRRKINEILKFVKKNVFNLKELEVDTLIRGFDVQINSFGSDKIERFGLSDTFESLDDNKQLIDMFPKMKHFAFKSLLLRAVDLLEYVAIKHNLESLYIHAFDVNIFTVTFPKLKIFSVQTFSLGKIGFNSFIARHAKSLEELSIGDSSDIDQFTVSTIISCKNLKSLSIDVSNHDLLLVMTNFNEILSRTKPLTITFREYPTIVRFELPGDKIFWDEQMSVN